MKGKRSRVATSGKARIAKAAAMMAILAAAAAFGGCLRRSSGPPPVPRGTVVLRDVPYVTDGHARQVLDLYLPKDAARPPLVILIHGGAFRGGSKSHENAARWLREGYAVAAVDYRLSGDAIFPAQIEDCKESNGMPGIQTSVGAQMLPWDQEECRAWHTPMKYTSQRPVAWTQGTFNNAACTYENQKVWTSGNNLQNGTIDVLLVNGDTGAIESNVKVSGITPDYYGIYGAAVDQDGNFWGSQLSQGYLVNVNRQTLQYKVWPMAAPGYGMTVDSKGYV